MTSTSLAQALRACASGIYAAEAATGMLIAHATWLDRDDFRVSSTPPPERGWPQSTGQPRPLRSPQDNCPAHKGNRRCSAWPPASRAMPGHPR